MSNPPTPAKPSVRVVGLGSAGRAIINTLAPLSTSRRGHVVVGRDAEALRDCDGETVLLRQGNPPQDVAELRHALEGAELVIVAGSTDEGLTPLIVRIAKAQGSAVARVVETVTIRDPFYGLDHMLNEIIGEHNAWIAGKSVRSRAPRNVTPSD